MRRVSQRRNPYARFTRKSISKKSIEKRTGREQGPRGSRILIAGRSPRATICEVRNAARAKWRNWKWCIARACGSYIRRVLCN
jgi:hypothetical protein